MRTSSLLTGDLVSLSANASGSPTLWVSTVGTDMVIPTLAPSAVMMVISVHVSHEFSVADEYAFVLVEGCVGHVMKTRIKKL